MPSFAAGQKVYKWELKHRISSEGAFGDVWLAHDYFIGRDLAVKILDPMRTSISDVLREAHTGNRFDHPNLVKVHYADFVNVEEEKQAVIAMEYYANGSISSLATPCGYVPLNMAIGIFKDVLRGLGHLHSKGVLHNDIKPNNILLGDQQQGILSDYGISAAHKDGQSTYAEMFYHPHAAPETIESNRIDFRTDIYQVGLTFFRMANGLSKIEEKFHTERDFKKCVIKGKLVQPTDYCDFIPINLKKVINKAIHPDPSKRFQSALKMQRALEGLYFRGFWRCDASGKHIGEDDRYIYEYEQTALGKGKYSFQGRRESKQSHISRKINKYCSSSLSKTACDQMRRNFMQDVVKGIP